MKIQRKKFTRIGGAVLLTLLLAVSAFAQAGVSTAPVRREIAVTIDDLPLNGPSIEPKRLTAMTANIVNSLKKYGVPAVGFVNESLLYSPGNTEARLNLLREWREGGVELGNHTFSHIGFKDHSLAEFEDDFVRGDTITRRLLKEKGQSPRYFRHPFLQMGATREIENSFEGFIAARGYKAVPVTVDTMDWMFLSAYNKAAAGQAKREIADQYLKFAGAKLDFAEQTSTQLFGRQIPLILLLHANELNGDNFDALVKIYADRGYRFVTVEHALNDPSYKYPETYIPTSDWLSQWAASKNLALSPPSPPESIQKAFAGTQK